jgi:hypothetical protein
VGRAAVGQRRLTLAMCIPCGKREPSEWKGSEAGAVCVQVRWGITRHHCPCLITAPRRLVLTHGVSSLMLLRDRGDGGDSQQAIQTMLLSTSVTLMVVLATHWSEGLVRVVHGDRHDVATVPPRAHRTRLRRDSKVLNLFAYSTHVRQWYAPIFVICISI